MSTSRLIKKAALFQAQNNTELQPIISSLSNISKANNATNFPPEGEPFNLTALISPAIGAGKRYAYYDGGLTTPICNEVVRWINIEEPLTISGTQLAAFR